MKIFSVLFPVLFIFFSLNIQAQKEIVINHFRPYQYDAAKNTVKAWIDQKDSGKDFTISLDGKMINYSETDSGRVELLLPLAGNDGEMVFSSSPATKNSAPVKQHFRPLIPSDWGYFGKGTVNIICSSHQDIAWMNTPDSCREERIHKIIIPALDIIDKNPSYKFEMEQTLNLMEVLDEVPSERQRIINAFKRGQFTWGATFNQPILPAVKL